MSRSNDLASGAGGYAPLASPAFTGTPTGIVTGSIADNAITLDKLAHLGTDGHVLTSTGTGSAPAFEAPPGGGMDFISITNFPSSSPTFNVDNIFSSAYESYKVILRNIRATDTEAIRMLFNNSTGGALTADLMCQQEMIRDSDSISGVIETNDRFDTSPAYFSANAGSNDGEALDGEFLVSGVKGDDDTMPTMTGVYSSWHGTDRQRLHTTAIHYRAEGTECRGFRMTLGAGTFQSGKVIVYGFKEA